MMYACPICDEQFNRRYSRDQHLERVHEAARADHPLPATSQGVLCNDPTEAPDNLNNDVLNSLSSDDLRVFYRQNWNAIRSRCRLTCKKQKLYNIRLTKNSLVELKELLKNIFFNTRVPLKISASVGMILINRHTDQPRLWHASYNTPDLFGESGPILLSNIHDLNMVLNQLDTIDIGDYTKRKRPHTAYRCECVVNITVYAYEIQDHPIGAPIALPKWLKDLKCLKTVSGKDNLCFFRCLASHKANKKKVERLAKEFFDRHMISIATRPNLKKFKGVKLEELYKLANLFMTNIVVYKLNKIDRTCKLVYRTQTTYDDTMYLDMYKRKHFSYIVNIANYCQPYLLSRPK